MSTFCCRPPFFSLVVRQSFCIQYFISQSVFELSVYGLSNKICAFIKRGMPNVCVICCDSMESREVLKWPGCCHEFHSSCALNAAQYDVRCPLCRHTCDDIIPRKYTLIDALEQMFQGPVRVAAENQPPAVTVQTSPSGIAIVDMMPANVDFAQRQNDTRREFLRTMRSYAARRRRVVNGNPRLMELRTKIKCEERELAEHDKRMCDTWRERSNSLWNADEFTSLRREHTRLQRRLTRHRLAMRRHLEGIIGEEPVEHASEEENDGTTVVRIEENGFSA